MAKNRSMAIKHARAKKCAMAEVLNNQNVYFSATRLTDPEKTQAARRASRPAYGIITHTNKDWCALIR